MELYESLFTPYPFAKERYGHAQFGWGGGMEHQTMTFVNSFFTGTFSSRTSTSVDWRYDNLLGTGMTYG